MFICSPLEGLVTDVVKALLKISSRRAQWMHLWRTMRKRAHIWATAFWIKMEQNRRRRRSSPFSSPAPSTLSPMLGHLSTDLNTGISPQKPRRERPLGVCTSPQHCLQGVEGWLTGSKGLLSLTTSENPIWHPKKVEVAIGSERLVRALRFATRVASEIRGIQVVKQFAYFGSSIQTSRGLLEGKEYQLERWQLYSSS